MSGRGTDAPEPGGSGSVPPQVVAGGDPDPEQLAAIAAAAAVALDAPRAPAREERSMWVHASRRAAQRSGLQRGPWRLSGRLPRRSRT